MRLIKELAMSPGYGSTDTLISGANGWSMVISSLLNEHFNAFSFISVFSQGACTTWHVRQLSCVFREIENFVQYNTRKSNTLLSLHQYRHNLHDLFSTIDAH